MLINALFTPEYVGQMLASAVVFALLLGAQTFIHWAKAKRTKDDTNTRLKSIEEKVEHTKYEVSTNGGDKTLKDLVIKMSNEQWRIKNSLDRCINDISVLSGHLVGVVKDRAALELTMNSEEEAQYIANEKGDVEFVNYAMIELFGANAAHLKKRKRFNFIETQEEKEEVNESVMWCVVNKLEFSKDYTILNRKRNKTRLVCETFEAVNDAEGLFKHFLGTIKVIK